MVQALHENRVLGVTCCTYDIKMICAFFFWGGGGTIAIAMAFKQAKIHRSRKDHLLAFLDFSWESRTIQLLLETQSVNSGELLVVFLKNTEPQKLTITC